MTPSEENNKRITLKDIISKTDNNHLNDEIVVLDAYFSHSSPQDFPLFVDSLMILLVKAGSGRIGIDLEEYEIREDTLIVLQPRNYIVLSECNDDSRVHLIGCSPSILEEVMPKLTDVLPLLLQHRMEPVKYLSHSDAELLEGYYQFIRAQLQNADRHFMKQKVLCLLQAALYEMMEINHRNFEQAALPRTRKEELMAKFILLVTENFRNNRQVSFYSDKLCITSKHLSTIVKSISGRTAGEWIDNYVIMEAKVMLKTTDLSIQEIAIRLNFATQSFFGKFFKHQTGMSPTEYRRRNG